MSCFFKKIISSCSSQTGLKYLFTIWRVLLLEFTSLSIQFIVVNSLLKQKPVSEFWLKSLFFSSNDQNKEIGHTSLWIYTSNIYLRTIHLAALTRLLAVHFLSQEHDGNTKPNNDLYLYTDLLFFVNNNFEKKKKQLCSIIQCSVRAFFWTDLLCCLFLSFHAFFWENSMAEFPPWLIYLQEPRSVSTAATTW